MRTNSKAKGSAFERNLCSKLSLWWTGGKKPNVFWRTSSSGGRATQRAKKGEHVPNSAGDIMALDPVGIPFLQAFAVEIKRGYQVTTIHDLVDKSPNAAKQTYEKWIEQANESRKQADSRSWLIIHKRDRRECVVTLPYSTMVSIMPNEFDPLPVPHMTIEHESHRFGQCILLLDSFLQIVTPNNVLFYVSQR